MIYLHIISRYQADPAAWESHVRGGDINPARLVQAQMVAQFYALVESGSTKAAAYEAVQAKFGYQKKETVRSLIRRLS